MRLHFLFLFLLLVLCCLVSLSSSSAWVRELFKTGVGACMLLFMAFGKWAY